MFVLYPLELWPLCQETMSLAIPGSLRVNSFGLGTHDSVPRSFRCPESIGNAPPASAKRLILGDFMKVSALGIFTTIRATSKASSISDLDGGPSRRGQRHRHLGG